MILSNTDDIIAGHIVLGKAILPAMGYIDFIVKKIISEKIKNSVSIYPLRIKNSVWYAPLSISYKTPNKKTHLDIQLTTEVDSITYWVKSKTVGTVSKYHATGVIEVYPEQNKKLNFVIPSSLPHNFKKFNSDEIYCLFLEVGIDYKTKFQCLRELNCSKDIFWGRIEEIVSLKTDLASPYMLDAAIQTVLFAIQKTLQNNSSNSVFIPFSLESIMFYAPLVGSCNVFAVPKKTITSSITAGFLFDVLLSNELGEILVEMKGLHIRSYQGSSKNELKADKTHQSNMINSQQWVLAATFTAEPIAEPLLSWAARLNWNNKINFSPYNQIHQEILNKNSLLATNTTGVNIIFCRLEDLASNNHINCLSQVSQAEIERHLTNCERCILQNGTEIAHLKIYETEYLYKEIFVEKTYAKHGISFKPGDVVIDIGGNIGMFSLFAISQCNDLRIFSCEPSPVAYEVLKKNLALYAPTATVLPVGISNNDGEGNFVFYPNSSVWSGFHTDIKEDGEALKQSIQNEVTKRFGNIDKEVMLEHVNTMLNDRLQKQTYRVQLRSLSSIMREHQIDKIDLLKVDAEKCEWDILNSISDKEWPKIHQVIVEVHDKAGSTASKIANMLQDKGFELAVVEEEMLQSSGLSNFYARRISNNMVVSTTFEQGIENNFRELLSLVKNTQNSRKVPTLFTLCPSSPNMLEQLSNSFIERMTKFMKNTLNNSQNIQNIDLADYQTIYGIDHYHDQLRTEMGRIPYTPEFFTFIATILVRRMHGLQRPPYKVIALDCDNTLWSGVVGEQGVDGININSNYRMLQKFMLQQKNQGMLLCLISKNNHEDVKKVFETRNDMILQWDDIVASQINWNNKSDNIKKIADTLNLGLDSFIFLDDNPVECAEVTTKYQQVLSLQLPNQSNKFLGFLSHIWAFDQIHKKTDEDSQRTVLYKNQVQREQFRQGVFSLKEFIDGLRLKIEIQPSTIEEAERISQLTQRTNQFNFFKKPLSVAEIIKKSQRIDGGCFTVKVTDRFGDYGICGTSFFSEQSCAGKDVLDVDGLLVSCRVLGRGVEYKIVNILGKEALKRDKKIVTFHFLKNEKNIPAENFLLSIGKDYREYIAPEQWFYKIPAAILAKIIFTPQNFSTSDTSTIKDKNTNFSTNNRLTKNCMNISFMQQLGDNQGILPTIEISEQANSRQKTIQEKSKNTIIDIPQTKIFNNDGLEDYIEDIIINNVNTCLKKSIPIDKFKAFSEFGIDSLAAINLVVLLNAAFAIKLPNTALFDYGCINDLRNYLVGNYRDTILNRMQNDVSYTSVVSKISSNKKEPCLGNIEQNQENCNYATQLEKNNNIIINSDTTQQNNIKNIAIIGMAARFPGVVNINEFWSLLLEGDHCISEVPVTRWNIANYFDEDHSELKKICRWGGFIEDIDKFDASFFNISGKEAKQMDPQQRLFLEESWHALEDAGYANREISNKTWGVYVGVDSGDYQMNLRQYGIPLDASAFMGNDASILAARIAYFMDLKGPAIAIDTASSSSLSAVHLACDSLKNGTVDMAIVGGVSVHTTANFHILCAKAGMLSADGRCKPFDHRADGFVPGEAVGIVILKRLEDANADKDNIYSVIKGSGMNQDGKTNGITAPSSLSQTNLICSIYDNFNINVDNITYIEAHGTGTKLGDPIEITALQNAFRKYTQRVGFCSIGSVKSNIGHCVHASGISALIKLLLSFKHHTLVPSINFEKSNPLILFDETPFVVNTRVQNWQSNANVKRMAAISSFGFSGTNVHMVLEEYQTSMQVQSSNNDTAHEPALLLLSTKSGTQLRILAQSLKDYLQNRVSINIHEIKNIAFTLQLGRESFSHRLAISGKNSTDIISGLDDFLMQNTFSNHYIAGVITQGRHVKDNKQQNFIMQEYLKNKKLDKIAECWVNGYQINWTALYPTKRQRVSGLPLYPFDRKTYWLPETNILTPILSDTVKPQAPISKKVTMNPAAPAVLAPITASKFASNTGQEKRVLASLNNLNISTNLSAVKLVDEGHGIFRLQINSDTNNNNAKSSQQMAFEISTVFNTVKALPDAKVLIVTDDASRFLVSIENDTNIFLSQRLYRLALDMPIPIIASMPNDAKGYSLLFGYLCDFVVVSTIGHYQYSSQQQILSQQLYQVLAERFNSVTAYKLLIDAKGIEGINLKNIGIIIPVFSQAKVLEQTLKLAQELATVPRESLVQLKKHLAIHLIRKTEDLANTPIAFNPDSALLERHERPLLTQNWLQEFETGQLTVPASTTHKVKLNTKIIKAEVFDNGILLVKLYEQESRNKFSKAFIAGFKEIFSHIKENSTYKVVVLTGYDHYFASGGTMETLLAIQGGKEKFTDEKIFALPLECEIPVIAAMQGHGIGPGWAIGMFCDDAIFSKESVYYSPYMQYGFTPGAGSTLIFPYRFGMDLAKEILFTARKYKGFELQAKGIKNTVLERIQVLSFALAVANHMAQTSRNELIVQKNLRSQQIRSHVEENYILELAMHEHTFVGNKNVLSRIQQYFNESVQTSAPTVTKIRKNVQNNKQIFDQVYSILHQTLSQELQIKSEDIKSDRPFIDLGLDSITSVTWIKKINSKYALSLHAAEVYSHPTLRQFTALVIQKAGLSIHTLVENNELKKTIDNSQSIVKEGAVINHSKHSQPQENPDLQLEKILQFLSQTLAQELHIKPADINQDIALVDLGLDSITGVTWIKQINKHYGLDLHSSVVYSHPTLRELIVLVLKFIADNSKITVADEDTSTLQQVSSVIRSTSEKTTKSTVLDNQILTFLINSLAVELQINPQDINYDTPFVDLGLDSITSVTWIKKINSYYALSLNSAEIYNHPTLRDFSKLIVQNACITSKSSAKMPITTTSPVKSMLTINEITDVQKKLRKEVAMQSSLHTMPMVQNSTDQPRQVIAVIGMSGQFPKAKNLEQYWENLTTGKDCISEIPTDRWVQENFFDNNHQIPGTTYSKWMGVLEDADKFDPLFFNISPREAELMDPQQRIFLEACWGSIENAGYNPTSFSGKRCGVFVGCGTGDYKDRFDTKELNAQIFMGNAVAILAARISYYLNLQGPSLTIDTACSSSLVAIASACDNLILGNNDLALAGGVVVLASPSMHIMTSKAGMLSEDGRCFTFDQRANGFVPSEGVGVVLLKRLHDALQDQDIIHGIINAWGVNQDGKSNGITAPNGDSQSRLEQEVYSKFNIDPEQIQLVETHGTGTQLGDPVEVEGLKNTFFQFTKKRNYCALGSVKSNIGHTLMTAGVASLIKVLIAMKHQQIPPVVHYQNINEHIDLEDTPFYINSEMRDWNVESGQKRQAAVSSFGFSGTNAHLVIEQFSTQLKTTACSTPRLPALIVLSVRNNDQFQKMITNLLMHVKAYSNKAQENGDSESSSMQYLYSIAYTLQKGREAMNERIGLIVQSLQDLENKLAALVTGDNHHIDGVYQGHSESKHDILSMFNIDEDVYELIKAWAKKGKLVKLLKLWVKGMNINWDILYPSVNSYSKPKRVTLPTYPFARDRYWIHTNHLSGSSTPIDSINQPTFESPKVHQSIEDNVAPFKFQSNFSVYEEVIGLWRTNSQAEVPGLLLLELAKIASQQFTQQNIVAFNNILWGRPANIKDAIKGNIQIYIFQEADGYYFQCVTEKLNSFSSHNFGQIMLSSPKKLDNSVNFHSIEKSLQQAINLEKTKQIRDMIDAMANPMQQGLIENICFDGNNLLATIVFPLRFAKNLEMSIFQPIVLASAWQLITALNTFHAAPGTNNNYWYPFSLDAIIAYQFILGRTTVYIAPNDKNSQLIEKDSIPGYDLMFYNESSELCIWINNLKVVKEEALITL